MLAIDGGILAKLRHVKAEVVVSHLPGRVEDECRHGDSSLPELRDGVAHLAAAPPDIGGNPRSESERWGQRRTSSVGGETAEDRCELWTINQIEAECREQMGDDIPVRCAGSHIERTLR